MSTDEAFADELINVIHHTFEDAYFAAAQGTTEDELLIDYDITAAFYDIDENMRATARKTIGAAVQAVHEQIDYETAHSYLIDKLRNEIAVVLISHERSSHAMEANSSTQ